MLLKNIKLVNFRNYSARQISFNNSFNFIHGSNGEGKTNILEAISYISFGKSFLGSSEQDCMKFGCSSFDIHGTYENMAGTGYEIRLNYDGQARRKSFFLNSEKISSWSSGVFGKFPVVFLSPHSLNITYGNPSERRKFFDILLAQVSRVYLELLKDYVRVLKQKNALLKNQTNGRALPGNEYRNLLNSLNEKLVDLSADVLARRAGLLNGFKSRFTESFSYLAGSDEIPGVRYSSEYLDFEELQKNGHYEVKADALKQKITAALEEYGREEEARGLSIVGPHRDDYVFSLSKPDESGSVNSFEIKNFASQGEHKTFVIALKLAEYHYLTETSGNPPLLLLDDLLSELDSGRVSKIVSHLKEYGQIFLTTTDIGYAKELENYYSKDEISFFEINNGSVS
ncbi:MAG: DNA replication and repair protein RecF [Ignavibacteria bacterium]|nr:DNA replication and repair protein RecF [Ignavibacteria bacterium]